MYMVTTKNKGKEKGKGVKKTKRGEGAAEATSATTNMNSDHDVSEEKEESEDESEDRGKGGWKPNKTARHAPIRGRVRCNDCFVMSIQTSRDHVCNPHDDVGPCREVESGIQTS